MIVVSSDLIDHYTVKIIQKDERYSVIAESPISNVVALIRVRNLLAAQIEYRKVIRMVGRKSMERGVK